MSILAIYALLTTAMYYLVARATITRFAWTRYPPWFAKWADCSACSGFAYGFLIGTLALVMGWPGPLGAYQHEFVAPILTGLCSMVWTPIVGGLMQAGFERLGTTVPENVELSVAIDEDKTSGRI